MTRLEKLAKALENVEKRKRNTQTGKEKVIEIIKLLNELFNPEDKKMRILSKKEVSVIYKRYDYQAGRSFYNDTIGQIIYQDGEIYLGYPANSLGPEYGIAKDTDPDTIVYINFSEFTEAVEEAIEKLITIKNWEEELEKLDELIKALETIRKKQTT